MPTENERKYILKIDCEKDFQNIFTKFEILQGYLISTKGITVRIRQTKNVKKNIIQHYFAVKTTVNGRNIEIENKISSRDFKDLWEVALNKLVKNRYCFKSGNENWDVDFFKDYKDNTYLAMAEVELPETVKTPSVLPNTIKKNIVYKVKFNDTRFNNKLLSDIRYTNNLLNSISKRGKHVKA